MFIVPFDNLKSVAKDHVSYLPVGLLLAGSWDNVEALRTTTGPSMCTARNATKSSRSVMRGRWRRAARRRSFI